MAAEHHLPTKLISGARLSPSWLPNTPSLPKSSLELCEVTGSRQAYSDLVRPRRISSNLAGIIFLFSLDFAMASRDQRHKPTQAPSSLVAALKIGSSSPSLATSVVVPSVTAPSSFARLTSSPAHPPCKPDLANSPVSSSIPVPSLSSSSLAPPPTLPFPSLPDSVPAEPSKWAHRPSPPPNCGRPHLHPRRSHPKPQVIHQKQTGPRL
ncbi:hypothetical protein L484_016404 [Morus notabilis]|uniref:Uncharacterized protein n=1 Tax=Morus notabilis TaxID=981085 RepID=W9RNE0_9ROSA|nr:hypothetical protein L484_016404 [Morus notabilis]